MSEVRHGWAHDRPRSRVGPVSAPVGPDEVVRVSTGSLPDAAVVRRLLEDAHALFAPIDEGDVADYIPVLARADPRAFGACVVSVNGAIASAGDITTRFSIQSVSKPFVFA